MSDLEPDKPANEKDTASVSQLVEGASDAAFAIDDQHQLVAWNQGAEDLLGYAPEEVIGRRCAEVIQSVLPGGEPLCMPDCEVFRCFHNGKAKGVPCCRVKAKNGSWVNVSYSSIFLPGQIKDQPNGSTVAMVLLHEKEQQPAHITQPGLLQIFTLGKFGLAANGCGMPIEKWKRRQAVTLLKILVTHLDRPVHRERILDCLWPDVDEERGWGRLKVTMYYLRTQLRTGGAGDDAIQTVGNAYLLRRDAVWVDWENFEKLVTEGRALQAKDRVEEALRCYDEAQFLYRGDYLEQDVFADCFAEERERLGEVYMELLTRKAECHAQREEYVEAVQVCRKALVHDPCRESFHCLLMQYLVHLGRVDWAIAQYRHCQSVLAREFGVDPMPETQRLYQQILEQQNDEDATSGSDTRSMVTAPRR